jgi:hypothetical protein
LITLLSPLLGIFETSHKGRFNEREWLILPDWRKFVLVGASSLNKYEHALCMPEAS